MLSGLDKVGESSISSYGSKLHNNSIDANRRYHTFTIRRQLLRTRIPRICHRCFPLVPARRRNTHRLHLCPATIHDERLNQLLQLPSSGPKTSMGDGKASNLALSRVNGAPALLPSSVPLSIQGRVSGRFSVTFPCSGSNYPKEEVDQKPI